MTKLKNLNHFEISKNIQFSITRKDGLKYDIGIGGITNVKDTGIYLKYLRDYTCTISNSDGTVIADFFVPYAKLIGEPLSNFNNEIINTLGFDKNTIMPRLLLTSVDRKTKGIISEPTLITTTIPMQNEAITLLPIPLEDIELIINASMGPQYINLALLYKFLQKTDSYGFSTQTFSSYFLHRISYPFLLFSIFLLIIIIAWNYRLQHDCVFRAYWLLIIPSFTILTEFIRIFGNYLIHLITLAFAKLNLFIQLPLILIIFTVFIIVLSMRFLKLFQKSIKNER